MSPAAVRENVRRLRVERQRPLREQKSGAIQQFDQGFGALLQTRHGRAQFCPHRIVELGRARCLRGRKGSAASSASTSSSSGVARI